MIWCWSFFFQAEDGIRDLVRSRGLGDVYKRQRGELPLPGLSVPGRAFCAPVRASHRAAQPGDADLSLIHI